MAEASLDEYLARYLKDKKEGEHSDGSATPDDVEEQPMDAAPKVIGATSFTEASGTHRSTQKNEDPLPSFSGGEQPQRRITEHSGGNIWESGDSLAFSPDVSIKGHTRTTEVSETGLRGTLNRLLGTHFARTQDELDMDTWIRQINAMVRPPKLIGVVSPKGGVGKTSTTQMIGSTISVNRSQSRVAAIDIDAASLLSSRMRPVNVSSVRRSITTFAQDTSIKSNADAEAYLVTNAEGFSVLPGSAVTGNGPINKQELATSIARLANLFPLIFLDFPGSVREVPVAQDALRWLDGMIFVTETTSDSISLSKHLLNQIRQFRPELLAHTVLLLNHRTSMPVIVDLDAAVDDFNHIVSLPDAGMPIFEVEYDPHLAEGAAIDLSTVDPIVRRRFTEISSYLMRVLPLTAPMVFEQLYKGGEL